MTILPAFARFGEAVPGCQQPWMAMVGRRVVPALPSAVATLDAPGA